MSRRIMLFVSDKTWQKIRNQFTADERATLRSTILNSVIAPHRGVDIDIDRLEAGLREKVVGAMLEANPDIRRG